MGKESLEPIGPPSVDDGLGTTEFEFLRTLMRADCGMAIGETSREMVRARLGRRLKALGLASFREYCSYLSGPDGPDELANCRNALTTKLTRFFRESHHFEHLELELTARIAGRSIRRLRLWSAGCSSGEEAYSMAMVLKAAIPDIHSWDALILASDIDTDALAAARAGEYSADAVGDVPSRFRRFFEPVGADRIRVGADLRRLVAVRSLNLMSPWPMRRQFDIIFCRNVTIYFDQAGQSALFTRLADILLPGGYLYVGHSESLLRFSDRFEPVGHTIYRRKG